MSVCSVRLAALDEESAGEDLLVETVALGETVALYGVGGAKVVETAIAAEVFVVAMVPVVGSSVEAVSLAETVVVVVDLRFSQLPEKQNVHFQIIYKLQTLSSNVPGGNRKLIFTNYSMCL